MPADQTTAQSTWTTERIQQLKVHFEAGLTCREIAAELGVSRNAVIGKISRLALVRDNGGDTRRVVRSDAARDPSRALIVIDPVRTRIRDILQEAVKMPRRRP